jgi:hypothetical protein
LEKLKQKVTIVNIDCFNALEFGIL